MGEENNVPNNPLTREPVVPGAPCLKGACARGERGTGLDGRLVVGCECERR